MKLTPGMHVHFMGIGGVGVSAAASLSLEQGLRVSGCDLQRNKYTRQLEEQGCRIAYHHDTDHIEDADLVVYTSAIPPDAPELIRAQERGIPVYKRGIFTLMLMPDKKLIGVSGSHGKTTTTWMTAHTFIANGREPSMMVGGTVPGIYGNFRIGKGEWFISEIDESDGTVAELAPQIAVITNVDREHMNYYPDMAALQAAYRAFCRQTAPDGTVILRGDDPRCMELAAGLEQEVMTFGLSEAFDVSAAAIRADGLYSIFDLIYKGDVYSSVRLAFCGEHNILNSLSAFCSAVAGGLDPESVIRGLESCRPVARRFEISGSMDEVLCINDYAHHPTEIKAVIRAVDNHLAGFRKVLVFQPHRYSRLRDCWDEFIDVLNTTTSIVIVLPVYSANEEPLQDISSRKFILDLQAAGVKAEYVKMELAASHLETVVQQGDCVIFLGAGNIGALYHEYADRIAG